MSTLPTIEPAHDEQSSQRFATRKSTQFSIGICAAGSAPSLPLIIEEIKAEKTPTQFVLCRIIVVASACREQNLFVVKEAAKDDKRIVLVEENERRGKADAINKIIDHCEGDFVVFVHSDAFPESGSISILLESLANNDSAGVASARPFLEPKKGLTSKLEQLMWLVHNESSLMFNHIGISNHSNDEMMIVRTSLIRRLPFGLVNDGAYLAANAKASGYSIKFCKDARVKISAPSRIIDSIGQRRRIIFGHFQIRQLLGKCPSTIESMLLFSPYRSLKILVKTLARNPRLVTVLPVAILNEALSLLGALVDTARSTQRHRVWKRYED